MAPPESLTITVATDPRHPWRHLARLNSDERPLCSSRTPFFDAARKLIALGYDPDTTLILCHEGSTTECLKARLGTAAALSVEETGYGPRFRRWKPLPPLAVSPRIAPIDQAATHLAAGRQKRVNQVTSGDELKNSARKNRERRGQKLNTEPRR
jgi:hypothetical protein